MLAMFDPTVEPEKEMASDVMLVPLYRNAKVVGGVLPGKLDYLSYQVMMSAIAFTHLSFRCMFIRVMCANFWTRCCALCCRRLQLSAC